MPRRESDKMKTASSAGSRATRSQGITPRSSRRLRGQSPPKTPSRRTPPKKKRAAATTKTAKPTSVHRGKSPATTTTKRSATESDPDETESDGDLEAMVTEETAAEPKLEDARDTVTTMGAMMELVSRMEANARASEAIRARERAEVEEAHRSERREMQQFFAEVMERSTQLVVTSVREAIAASASPREETQPTRDKRQQDQQDQQDLRETQRPLCGLNGEAAAGTQMATEAFRDAKAAIARPIVEDAGHSERPLDQQTQEVDDRGCSVF